MKTTVSSADSAQKAGNTTGARGSQLKPVLVPARLKQLREYRGLSITELSRKSYFSRRRLHEFEAKPNPQQPIPVRENTLKRLAGGLRVQIDVLTGEAPMPTDLAGQADMPQHELHLKLSPRTRQRYALACDQYGTSQEELIEMAPLLLTLVAEDSLRWRTRRLEEQQLLLRRIEGLQRYTNLDLIDGIKSPGEDLNLDKIEKERKSIESRELFGDSVLSEAEILEGEPNPFIDYLAEKVDSGLDSQILNLDVYGQSRLSPGGLTTPIVWPGQRLPEYELLFGHMRKLLRATKHNLSEKDEFQAMFDLISCKADIAEHIPATSSQRGAVMPMLSPAAPGSPSEKEAQS